MIKKIPFKNDVYVVSDKVEILIQAVKDGSRIIQLRDKSNDLDIIRENAKKILPLKEEYRFNFIINDFPEIALEVGADGVHVGQDDMSVSEIREILGDNYIIGKTTHNINQGLEAQKDGADYISVGPVFSTPTKPERAAVGIDYIKEASEKISIPFVTIGGIDLTNIDDILNAGANTIGIVRAADNTKNILKTIREFRPNAS